MTGTEQITKRAKVIVPENWDKHQKGKFWEKLVADLLRKRGFTVVQGIEFTGMEADCLAENLETHQKAWVECKFHKENIDAPVLNKLIGTAFRKEVTFAYLFSTSEPGSNAKGVIHEENEKNQQQPDRRPRLVFVGPEELAQWFMDTNGIITPELGQKNIGLVNLFTLLITPDQILWVAEETEDGEPCRAIIFPTSDEEKINLDKLCADFSRLNFWQGLEIIDGSKINKKTEQQYYFSSEINKEVVSPIGVAESFEHYQRPCAPQYFVGRSSLREKFCELLNNIKNGRELTRIVCFSGRSGLGKSSLVLRLQKDCYDPQYQNSFYLYHVDIRSAKGALFIVSAIRSAMQKAIEDGFIELPGHKISIESTEEPLFSSASVKLALEKLKSSRRVLTIFFDQFEEIFTKESLFCLYELFEKTAHEVDSLKENIVLGFCWRTGILMPDDHKAYHLWHGLRDKRIEFEVKDFIQEESIKLLKQFDTYSNNRRSPLDKKIKNWLLENCPGFPWLLRKILGDIYNHSLNQSDIIPGHQIDIKSLFDKDLEMYITTPTQENCLRYIAKHSPVGMNEVIEKFGCDVIKYLENQRLVIRTGMNYAIYWDILGEYIKEGKVPTIPLGYRPRNRLSTVLDSFKLIIEEEQKEITFQDFLIRLGKSKENVRSLLLDMQNFCLVTYQQEIIKAEPNLVNAGDDEIADYLARQLEDHILLQKLYDQLKPGKMMTLWGFQDVVKQTFSLKTTRRNTTKDYASRMLSWLLFTGLLEKQQKELFVRPIGDGKQKGKLSDCTSLSLREESELPLLKMLNPKG